jgi:amino acid adenylation domain-containing protein
MEDIHATLIVNKIEELCQFVVANPNCPVSQLPMFGTWDQRLIRQWNAVDSQKPQPATQLMHEIIHDKAQQYPELPAIESWEGTITYQELDRLSTGLAGDLRRHGVRPFTFVPVLFDKTVWAIVALLAVNKTGAAFVPLDPSHPLNRLKQIIERTGSTVLLVSERQSNMLQEFVETQLIVSSSTVKHLPCPEDGNVSWDLAPPAAPAYCLHTSGSTGNPKGCVVQQSAFSSIARHAFLLQMKPGSRVLQFASFSFGISLIEVFCTLTCGGTICMPSEVERKNNLTHAITSLDIDWALLTPTALKAFSPTEVPCLRTIISAGEPMHKADVAIWAERVRLFQAYGLTEWAGIFSVSQRVTATRSMEKNIGFPVDGCWWLVDPNDHTRLCAVGGIGEIVIEGPSLAQGYLHDAAKTSAAFIAPPYQVIQFGGRSGDRWLYKTGDLGRLNMDGSISHMGRKDAQVKIRGHRVELGEVEFHLKQSFPHAKRGVVESVIASGTGTPTLVAFIELPELWKDGESGEAVFMEPSDEFLNGALSAERLLETRLPPYAVPSTFLPLRFMPLTVSGKIDRRCLRNKAASLTPQQWRQYKSLAAQQMPSTPSTPSMETVPMETVPTETVSTEIERQLAQIWASLFGLPLEQVGPNDDFHVLGGDSVIAMRVTAMARAKGINLSVTDVFANPTLRSLGRAAKTSAQINGTRVINNPVDPQPGDQMVLCLSELRERGTLPASAQVVEVLPATDIQAFFIERSGLDMFTFFLEGELDVERMREACRAVIRKHSILRTVFTKNAHGLFQVILAGDHCNDPLKRIIAPNDLRSLCATFHINSPNPSLHLDQSPVGFTLASCSTTQHALIIALSHAQHDGFSINILFDDLVVAYTNASLSPAADGHQFADVARYRAGHDRTAGLAFWRNYLDGASPTRLGPSWSPVEKGTTSAVVTVEAEVPFAPTPPVGITLSTFVKAAWAVVLSRRTGQTDLVFGQTVNGRNLPLVGIDQILGPCINFVPFRVRLQANCTVREWLKYAQSQYLLTTDYEDVPLQQITRTCTSWPAEHGEGLPFIFQHQNVQHQFNLEFQSEDEKHRLISTSCEPNLHVYPLSEDWIFSAPYETKLKLQIVARESRLPFDTASSLVRELAEMVEHFARSPDSMMSSLTSNL